MVYCIDWPIELVATNYQMPPVINHKNILKLKMNPHKHKYSRNSIIRTPMCDFNVKGVQITEFFRISELSDKIHYLAS